jgi:hypothetical protein
MHKPWAPFHGLFGKNNLQPVQKDFALVRACAIHVTPPAAARWALAESSWTVAGPSQTPAGSSWALADPHHVGRGSNQISDLAAECSWAGGGKYNQGGTSSTLYEHGNH